METKRKRDEVNGDLNPENEGTDLIEITVNDNILNKNAKGYIQVSYGYMNFDEEHRAADGMQDDITFNLEEVREEVEDISQHLRNNIQQDKHYILSIINNLSL